MVSPQNPLKKDLQLLDENIRLELVRLAVEDYPQLKACDFEFHLPRPSYTYITLQKLEESYPECEFSLIIGADNWELFPRWRESEFILQHYPVIVYPRGKETLLHTENEAPAEGIPSQPHFLPNAPLFPISSTEIREAIQRGEDASAWVDEKVLGKIKELRLFSDNEETDMPNP